MNYTADIYQKALDILSTRREKTFLETERKKNEINKKIPELESIQTELSKIGFSISKVLLYPDDKQAYIQDLKKKSDVIKAKRTALLEKNGYKKDALEPKSVCSVCDDSGFVGEKYCSCHIQLLKDVQRRKIARIAPLDECTFESFDTKYYPETIDETGVSPQIKAERILNSCHRFAAGFTVKTNANLLLMGKTGLGKTHISLAITNVAIDRGFSVIYGTSQNILGDLQNEHFGRLDNLRYVEREVLDTDLLVLDDLGTEFSNNYSISCLYNIINTRLLSKKPTIVNTNCSMKQLEEKYGERITSRIAGCYTTLVLIGNDIRYIK